MERRMNKLGEENRILDRIYHSRYLPLFHLMHRRESITKAFEILESNFGSVESLITSDVHTIITTRLSQSHSTPLPKQDIKPNLNQTSSPISSPDSTSPSSPSCRSSSSSQTLPILQSHHLQSLLSHKVCALHIKNFLHPSVTRFYASSYLDQARQGKARNWKVSTSQGMESSDVMTIGMPR